MWRTVAVGSYDALEWVLCSTELLELDANSDVVLLPTAAAFTGPTEAALRTATLFDGSPARVEALMVTDRSSANEAYFARRVTEANWVILLDGSPLHARSTWRDSAVGEALATDVPLVAVGATVTVLGDEMIDPRGGAPTTGLGYRPGAVLTTGAGEEQLNRTRGLLGTGWPLIVIGALGVVANDGRGWQQVSEGDVTVSRGEELTQLERVRTR